MTCGTCIHWKVVRALSDCTGDDDKPWFGQCRRRPPEVLQVLMAGRFVAPQLRHDFDDETGITLAVQDATRFPITERDTACGEHDDGASIC